MPKALTASPLLDQEQPVGGDRPIALIDLKAQYRRLKPAIDAAMMAVLEDGRFIMGPAVAELETALAAHAGVSHAVTCASGTDALLIALMADGVGAGDAVFVPSFSFTATAEVIALLGASPVFVDVDAESYLIDIDDLAERIDAVRRAGALRPRAIIAVDLFGQPADYRRLGTLAARDGLLLVADAAQSFGGRSDGRGVGGLAPVTATSFFPAKPLGCYGDGGALFTDDADVAGRYRSIRAHGRGDAKYDIARVGLNSRLDTLQAAVLLAKLPALEAELAAKERVAARYDALLDGCAGLPKRLAGRDSAWAQYTIRIAERDRVAAALKARGIPSAVYYPKPMHRQPAYEQYGAGPGSLGVSERLSGEVLSLPMHADLDEDTVTRIASAVRDAAPSGEPAAEPAAQPAAMRTSAAPR